MSMWIPEKLNLNPRQFIVDKLQEIAKRFPEVVFKYEYHQNSQTHVIEVLPFDTYMSEEYCREEFQMEMDFETNFGNFGFETLLFVSTESLTQISSPEFIVDKDGVKNK